jgi:hypothetical protein
MKLIRLGPSKNSGNGKRGPEAGAGDVNRPADVGELEVLLKMA